MTNPKLPKAWEEVIDKHRLGYDGFCPSKASIAHEEGYEYGARTAFEHVLPLVDMAILAKKYFKPPCVDDKTKCVCTSPSYNPDLSDPGHIEPECCFYRDFKQALVALGLGDE